MSRPQIIYQAERFLRCRCPRCISLDARHPGQGYQLALFPYVAVAKPVRMPPLLKVRL